MDVLKLREYEKLSPFQIKDELIKLAGEEAHKTAHALLNAGRGNPNWVATKPRAAFFLLGQFALTESVRVMDNAVGIGGKPEAEGIAGRFETWLANNCKAPGAEALEKLVQHALKAFGFEPDAFVHELVDSIIGDNYPVPDRALRHTEKVVHEYLMWAMGVDPKKVEGFDLFPVEGGTAAMCYVFRCLKANRLLNSGDTIALGTPIFSPYLEIPELEDYSLNTVRVDADEPDGFQIPEDHFQRLLDPKVKAFFLVNPGNPTSVALNATTIGKLVDLVRNHRPDLMILTDDVYGTFVRGFHSLMGQLPRNTIGVYSYSKYFGCTGWRLGVIAVHKSNVFDDAIAAHPSDIQSALKRRYSALALRPEKIRFVDRIVADSRDVALNHTAGLSLPQQVMMTLFSLTELIDKDKAYQDACIAIVTRRFHSMTRSLGVEIDPGPNYDAYYGIIDFDFWLKKYVGEDVVDWIKANVHPLDIAFKIAEDHGIVLLNGSGFDAPDWSARVSFANLPDEAYEKIGRAVRSVARGYVEAYRASTRQKPRS